MRVILERRDRRGVVLHRGKTLPQAERIFGAPDNAFLNELGQSSIERFVSQSKIVSNVLKAPVQP